MPLSGNLHEIVDLARLLRVFYTLEATKILVSAANLACCGTPLCSAKEQAAVRNHGKEARHKARPPTIYAGDASACLGRGTNENKRFMRIGMMSAQKFLAVMIALCLNAACAARPGSLLIATEGQVAGSQTVSVFTISTREKSDEPGLIYSGERSETSSTKIVSISIPPGHETGRIEWPEENDPKTEFSVVEITEPSTSEVRQWFRDQETDGHVLIFTHGYNTRYGEGVLRLAQLTHDLGIKAAPVLFTWPSRGKLGSYLYDRESASIARDTLEQVIRIAAASNETETITVLAHSMGGWITMEALRQYAIRKGALDPKIKNIILASPDIDIDLFAHQVDALGDARPEITILLSNDDRALSLSRVLAGNVSRLGAVDVNSDTYATKMADIKGIKLVDLSELEDGGGLHHSKFAEAQEAIDFLGAEIAGYATSFGLTRQAEAVIIGLSQAMEGAGSQRQVLGVALD